MGFRSFTAEVQGVVCCSVWVLGAEPQSSKRAVSALAPDSSYQPQLHRFVNSDHCFLHLGEFKG